MPAANGREQNYPVNKFLSHILIFCIFWKWDAKLDEFSCWTLCALPAFSGSSADCSHDRPRLGFHSVCVAVGKSFSWANCGNLVCIAPRRGMDLEHGRSIIPPMPWDQNVCSCSASQSLCCGKPPGEPENVSVLAWSLCLPGCKSWNINWKAHEKLNVGNCVWLEHNHDVQLINFSFVVMFWWFFFFLHFYYLLLWIPLFKHY